MSREPKWGNFLLQKRVIAILVLSISSQSASSYYDIRGGSKTKSVAVLEKTDNAERDRGVNLTNGAIKSKEGFTYCPKALSFGFISVLQFLK